MKIFSFILAKIFSKYPEEIGFAFGVLVAGWYGYLYLQGKDNEALIGVAAGLGLALLCVPPKWWGRLKSLGRNKPD